MPFVPFTSTKTSDSARDANPTQGAPSFTKKAPGRIRNKRKTGKVAPAQKGLMQPGRSMGGSR